MGDPARFRHFADFIAARFPDRSAHIADVAGGKGQLHATSYHVEEVEEYLHFDEWQEGHGL